MSVVCFGFYGYLFPRCDGDIVRAGGDSVAELLKFVSGCLQMLEGETNK